MATKPLVVQADSLHDAPETTDSDLCLTCHNRSKPPIVFPDGETLSINVDLQSYESSVHAVLECSECHQGFEEIPHPEHGYQTLQEYRLSYHDSCQRCHQEQFNQVKSSIHEELFLAGEEGTPICADCHQPHSQMHLCNPDEKATFEDRIWIAEACSSCHQEVYDIYLNSIHGQGLVNYKNPDMPTCIDCHNVHQICDPNEAIFRINSLEMCADCHTDPEIMDKYGHPVNVLNTYIVFHDTTVTMLEKYNSDELTSKPTCYDCHGIHNVDNLSNPPPVVFDLPGADLYPPIETGETPVSTSNVAVTGIVLGILVGGAGSLTIAQIIRERKDNGFQKKDGDQDVN